MTKEQLDSLFKGISLLPKIQKRLERICEEPEGEVEAKWIHRLIQDYFFSPKQIDTNVPAGAGRSGRSLGGRVYQAVGLVPWGTARLR